MKEFSWSVESELTRQYAATRSFAASSFGAASITMTFLSFSARFPLVWGCPLMVCTSSCQQHTLPHLGPNSYENQVVKVNKK